MTEKKFRLVEHTADIGLVAYGNCLNEAFENAAFGMFSIITDLRKVKPTVSRAISIREDSYEDLLFEWLNTLLYHLDVEGIIFRKFNVSTINDRCLSAECSGEIFDPNRHTIKTAVKSATYHLLEVNRSKCSVKVILDV